MSENFSPSAEVENIHNVLHLDSQLMPSSNDFDVTYYDRWNDYTRSLIPIPAICLSIGILAVLSFQISICCRSVKSCYKCLPHAFAPVEKKMTMYRWIYILLTIFTILLVISAFIMIFANIEISNALDVMNESFDFLSTTFRTLDNSGTQLFIEGRDLQGFITQAIDSGCGGASSVQGFISDYFDACTDYVDEVSPVRNEVDGFLNIWWADGEYRTIIVYILFSVPMVLILLYSVGFLLRKKGFLMIDVGLSEFYALIVFSGCSLILLGLMFWADFCMDPVDNAIMISPNSVLDANRYYLTCLGENPFQSSLDSAQAEIDEAQQTIQGLLSGECAGNTALSNALQETNLIETILTSINTLAECPPIQTEALEALQNGACEDGFQGAYYAWLGLFVGASFLFVSAILVSIGYNYVEHLEIWTVELKLNKQDRDMHDAINASAAGNAYIPVESGGKPSEEGRRPSMEAKTSRESQELPFPPPPPSDYSPVVNDSLREYAERSLSGVDFVVPSHRSRDPSPAYSRTSSYHSRAPSPMNPPFYAVPSADDLNYSRDTTPYASMYVQGSRDPSPLTLRDSQYFAPPPPPVYREPGYHSRDPSPHSVTVHGRQTSFRTSRELSPHGAFSRQPSQPGISMFAPQTSFREPSPQRLSMRSSQTSFPEPVHSPPRHRSSREPSPQSLSVYSQQRSFLDSASLPPPGYRQSSREPSPHYPPTYGRQPPYHRESSPQSGRRKSTRSRDSSPHHSPFPPAYSREPSPNRLSMGDDFSVASDHSHSSRRRQSNSHGMPPLPPGGSPAGSRMRGGHGDYQDDMY